MNIETKTVDLIKITAEEGKVLTDGMVYSEVGGSVYLGAGDSADNWREISEEEYNKIAEEERAANEEAGKYI